MTERQQTVPSAPGAAKPPLPREHGAWGILLVPFASAAGLSGVVDLKMTLLLVSVLSVFVARSSLQKRQWHWAGLWLALCAASAAPLLWIWHRWWLLAFGVAAAPLALRKTERALPAQLLALTGLTATAPAAWYVATGALDAWAWKLWLLNSLYFAGGFFYVKMHLTAAIHRTAAGMARWTIGYHALLVVALVGLVMAGQISWVLALAFGPSVVRAGIGAWRLSPQLRIKRLAWGEVAWAVVFGLSLIVAGRLVQ